jgi:Lipase maturation factor
VAHDSAVPELVATDYTVARAILEHGIAAIYVIAFVVALRQFPALCGDHGLEPARDVVDLVPRFLDGPSIFRWTGYSDTRLRIVAWTGIVVAGLLFVGLPEAIRLPAHLGLLVTMACWFSLWILYQSVVNIGGTFYAFGWETLLLEAGFLAIFLGNGEVEPQWPILLGFRWLAFRVELGAGLIKLRGDRCWRQLSCMDYHQETQPLPNPLSWFFHHLPRPLHRLETFGNFVAQLIVPFGLFLPQPFATIAAGLMILTQLYLVVSGNYAWLNWLTILAISAAVADPVVRAVVPALSGAPASAYGPTPTWFEILVVAYGLLLLALSYRPVMNLLSPSQAMNASFEPFRLVNTYGAFGSVSRVRDEVIVEGTASERLGPDTEWREYGFRAKPGDVRRLPPQVAPYHLRLDWLMWFLPLSPSYGERWFVTFLVRLLEGDGPTLALLRHNPFPDRPPRYVRATMYRYAFTSLARWRATGAWWDRRQVGAFVQPIRLRADADEALGADAEVAA